MLPQYFNNKILSQLKEYFPLKDNMQDQTITFHINPPPTPSQDFNHHSLNHFSSTLNLVHKQDPLQYPSQIQIREINQEISVEKTSLDEIQHISANHKKRPRKVLTKQLINQLNESFKIYQETKNQQQNSCYSLKNIAKSYGFGYSTVRKKYQQYKKNLLVSQGKRIINPSKIYSSSQLFHFLITRIMQQGIKFQQSKELSEYLNIKYGLQYNCQTINRQLRRMGIKLSQPNFTLQQPQSNQSFQFLLNHLVKMNRIILYFGKYRFQFTPKEISRFGVLIKILIQFRQIDFIEILKDMIGKYCYKFAVDYKGLWYLIMSKNIAIPQQLNNINMILKENMLYNKLSEYNPKIIFTPQISNLSPIYQIYKQITYKICVSKLNMEQCMTILPEWLDKQQETVGKIVIHVENNFNQQNNKYQK